MKQKHNLVVILLTVWLIQGCAMKDASDGTAEGRASAEADIRSGKLHWILYGKPRNDHDIFARIVHERFGFQFVDPSPFPRTDIERSKVEGYNKRMDEEFVKRFGSNALNQASEDARQEWQSKRRNKDKGPA